MKRQEILMKIQQNLLTTKTPVFTILFMTNTASTLYIYYTHVHFITSYTICYEHVDIIPKCTGTTMSMLENRQPVLKMFPLHIPPMNVGFMFQVLLREAFHFSLRS